MDVGLTITSRPVGRAAWIGMATGILLGEVWGYLEGMLRWMHSHEYQVVKAIHGTLIALLSHSGTALQAGLILGVFCGVIRFIIGLVTGIGMATLGIRLGAGTEWVMISVLGIFLGMWLSDGFGLSFYWRLLIISVLIGAAVSWLTVHMNQRLLGQRLVTPSLRHWMWGGHLLALAMTAIGAHGGDRFFLSHAGLRPSDRLTQTLAPCIGEEAVRGGTVYE